MSRRRKTGEHGAAGPPPAAPPAPAPAPAVRRVAGEFVSADGLRIHTEAWLPGQARAAVLLVHGFAEHVGRYDHVGRHLAQRGYAVHGLDHRAHGQSAGEPRAFIPQLEPVLLDLEQLEAQARAAWPGLRVFVYGHSMGAFISVAFALRRQRELQGLVTSGVPLLIDTIVPRYVLKIAGLLAGIAPRLPLVKLDLDGVSRDPAVVAAYKSDPLVHPGRLRARMAVNWNRNVAELRARVHELTLPLLILHGAADPTVPPAGSQLLFERASSADKTLRLYPGLYHEVHNEPEQAQVLAEIVEWLDRH